MELNRRGFLSGIIAACAAPAIIRTPGLLMPVKPGLVSISSLDTAMGTDFSVETLRLNLEYRWFLFNNSESRKIVLHHRESISAPWQVVTSTQMPSGVNNITDMYVVMPA